MDAKKLYKASYRAIRMVVKSWQYSDEKQHEAWQQMREQRDECPEIFKCASKSQRDREANLPQNRPESLSDKLYWYRLNQSRPRKTTDGFYPNL